MTRCNWWNLDIPLLKSHHPLCYHQLQICHLVITSYPADKPMTLATRHAAATTSSSFAEDFKVLVKQTLNSTYEPCIEGAASPPLGHPGIDSTTRPPVHDTRSGCSQPIEIDWNRRRTHSLDELDARDMHLRRKLHSSDAASNENEFWTCGSPTGVDDDDDDCIFALDL
ncbi:hypothetical protein DYB26_005244 [Aphanomyces astaci]|uniref:Uncharacterized protein n=1 Tax=Aphanomyces astaci TaxID=112090 RepID=A0A397DUL9_APHAT|nr:hypothetical protein DYB38_002030 [Aphanomyces astaci]RHZ04408.1 hypothetical protein DYB31_009924 [Aphanomyces astaci]RHZ25317.1 hypothetical protein DYB26_005244 [Aphanomyces astaci]